MRHQRFAKTTVLLFVAACAEGVPTSASPDADVVPSLSSGDDRGGHRRAFNTKMRAEDEIPTSTSLSTGAAHLRIPRTGPIRSSLEVRNTGNEVIRFCHIHWINPANAGTAQEGTGPVVWFLTPTGVNLQLVSSFFGIAQDADYVNNTAFGADTPENEAIARAALVATPSAFYVNCHSNAFPAGFIRGNLPGHGNSHR